MLQVSDLAVNYGNVQAVKGVSFNIKQGEIVVIIGSNGAGKTTIMKAVSGLLRPTKGTINFKNKNISPYRAEKIVQLGIAHMPEGRWVFPDQTVLDNLLLGAWIHRGNPRRVRENIARMFSYFPRLEERKNQLAGTLSGGEQQMLAISRSLMSEPQLLLLDEPSMGLAPLIILEIFNIIGKLNQEGMTVLLVEQMAFSALKIAHRGYVLETGRIVLEGQSKELTQNPRVIDAYLGGKRRDNKLNQEQKEASL